MSPSQEREVGFQAKIRNLLKELEETKRHKETRVEEGKGSEGSDRKGR